ncbi:uncharacterized protein LOC117256008 [Epinephelus lanceolatus]|uniref:uncharacterized protein si:rp71-81e14.2 n=1 Tax=Epinephelus lanceolatus TaxID=310571 RepID=UPI00144767BA|nr:uncharacterized protein si:rp71-81e14.2 [Epinephelus lanceolatus]
MMHLCWFTLFLCLSANAENNAVWRESGKNVTLECSSAGCPTSIKGYDAMYLYQYQDLKEPQQVLYYFSNTELNVRTTPGQRYTGRIQTEGSLQSHTITISSLTVDDSGVYKCVYTKIPSEVECNAYTLFVRGVAPCSRSAEVPCARTSEKSPPLVLIIIGACTISMLVIVINIILIIPRVRRWKRSKRTTAARVRQVSNDNVYEIMTKTGLHTALEESSPDLSQFA